jgi:phospholipid/cholesterol/gamma-HCH transport system substrate-binding protein
MRNTLETRLGVFFAMAMIAAFIILEVVGGIDFFKGGYRVYALFNNAQELKAGDPVKMGGVPIGRVERIRLEKGKVKVALKLDRDAEVRTDSKATIRFTGLMGQNYVSVDFGTPNGTKADPESILETVEQADLSVLMSKLDNVASGIENVTRSFSGDKIDNLLGPITDVIKENKTNITDFLANVRLISLDIAEGRGTVGKLIKDDTLYTSALASVTNLNETAGDLRAMMRQASGTLGMANSIVQQISAGQGTLGKLTKDEKLYNETTVAMTNLREILQKINQGQGSVGQLVNDPSLLKNVKLSLQKLDKATEGLEDQGPLSVLGMAVNSLF